MTSHILSFRILRTNIRCQLFAGTVLLFAISTTKAAESISLAGSWRFEIAATNANAFARTLSGKIHLPGTMDDAGRGPKNTNAPTLAGPYRLYNYTGPAWYQRDIEIPADWAGRHQTLFLEHCRWNSTVWLDDRCCGSQDSLIAPHVYDFGTNLAPGRHRLTLCVDNTVKLYLGKFVSALFGGTWDNMNGITGKIEMRATPAVWLADVQVYPDTVKMQARVAVRIGNATPQPGHGQLVVNGQSSDVAWDEHGGEAQVTVDMRGAKLWDEFAPNLSEVTVKLGDDARTVRFGMRDFAIKGTQFTLNGRPIFLRGTVEDSEWPLTGYPPADEKSWRRVFEIIKSYGLNFMRFHSYCPPAAAFTAADEAGVMIQVEGPQANVPAGKVAARDAFVEAEFRRIVDTYGNHPSFCLMTLGNEYGGKDELLTGWVDMLIKRDPRHLYSSASSAQTTANRQWTENGMGRGIHGPGTQSDANRYAAADGRPLIGHEIGQWMYYPDFSEIPKWKGAMALRNFEMIRNGLEKKHQLELAPRYVQASGRFATLLYKEEIEQLLRTTGYGGFSLLDLHDYPTQGTALVGPLDAFWDSKGFITPEDYRRFCNATVPLLRMPKRVYTGNEPFTAKVDLAHYGPSDLHHVEAAWSIQDERGIEIAAGKLPVATAPTGKLTPLGDIHASLAGVQVAGKFRVSVSLPGTPFANDWEIWIYPPIPPPQPPPDVVVCEKWDAAKTALAAGKKVVFFAQSANTTNSIRGKFLPVFWSPVWFPSQKPNTMGLLIDPQHPLFAEFPTEFHSNWQWYELMQQSRVFILDGTAADYRLVLQVIDNFERNHKLGAMFEGRAGNGRLLVCGLDLLHQTNEPNARQLLASLYHYVGSASFKPAHELDSDLLDNLFKLPKRSSGTRLVDTQASADSADADECGAAKAIDGDPDTFWHTAWHDPAPDFPHWLELKLSKPTKITGFTALPRQDGNQNGWIKDFAFYTSNDGVNWGEPAARGSFAQDEELKAVKLAAPVMGCFIKLVALSGYATGPWASLAEFNLTTAGDTQPLIDIAHAPAPLFNDPIYHGTSDCFIIWNPAKQLWFMYYTQRRSSLPNPRGNEWIYGSAIGIATSKDGLDWKYQGVCQGDHDLSNPIQAKDGRGPTPGVTWWAPAYIYEGKTLHMFVAHLDGVYFNWDGKRNILHFTSEDGVNFKYINTCDLKSDHVIDPTVYKIGDTFYMVYKEEADHSSTYVAESKDMITWINRRRATPDGMHEAPFVFRWKDRYWLIVDALNNNGLRIYQSPNGIDHWTVNNTVLSGAEPGRRNKDNSGAYHPDIVVQTLPDGTEQCLVFYFTHYQGKLTAIQVAELELGTDGKVTCDRNKYAATTPKN